MDHNCEPINKNRIRGAAEQGERTRSRRALVAKAKRCISGGCAVKECALTRGGLALCLKGRRANTVREGASKALVMIPPQHQMSAPAGRVAEQEDEALPDATSDETGLPRRRTEQVLTACRSRTLKGIGSTTSTSCGIVWRRAATCRHRSSESISRRAMARPAPWVFFHCVGSYRPDGGQAGPGAEVGETLPPGLLWVPAKQVRASGTGTDQEALLAI